MYQFLSESKPCRHKNVCYEFPHAYLTYKWTSAHKIHARKYLMVANDMNCHLVCNHNYHKSYL